LGGVLSIRAGSATPGTAPRGVAETPESLRDEDVPAPCDAPHQTPRPVRS
ncbi:glycosyl transferase, partial [Streptomyces griseus]